MAWISGLADKAEEVLNNIDKSTAAVLKKHDSKKDQHLTEVVTSSTERNDEVISMNAQQYLKSTEINLPLLRKSASAGKMSLSTSATPIKQANPSNLESDNLLWLNIKSRENTNSIINAETASDNSSDSAIANGEVISIIETDPIIEINQEGNEQISSIKAAKLKAEKLQIDYIKETNTLKEKVSALSAERSWFLREISDLTSTLEKTRAELTLVESELEQHRARALKTLQERDKLISDLRNNSRSELEDTSVPIEIHELRQEREILREEISQIREKLKQARQECIDADLNAEKLRQKTIEANIQIRDQLANEKRKRMNIEEDVKLKNEEICKLQEKLKTCHAAFTTKIQKQESEVSRLKSQISTLGSPNTEIESRLTSLTRTLVLKQQEFELLVSERNALRLQIEKMEEEYQNWRRNLSFNNINDTDDAKAQIPSFLIESPFDTSVARRVKRAYSTLDAIGVRIGVFLRRYPLARIFVLLYMALLQFWVMVVLFSQSPDAH